MSMSNGSRATADPQEMLVSSQYDRSLSSDSLPRVQVNGRFLLEFSDFDATKRDAITVILQQQMATDRLAK